MSGERKAAKRVRKTFARAGVSGGRKKRTPAWEWEEDAGRDALGRQA